MKDYLPHQDKERDGHQWKDGKPVIDYPWNCSESSYSLDQQYSSDARDAKSPEYGHAKKKQDKKACYDNKGNRNRIHAIPYG